MKTTIRSRLLLAWSLLALSALAPSASDCLAQPGDSDPISVQRIEKLLLDLDATGRESTATRQRRGLKKVIRAGEELLRGASAAPNRWRVLDVIFQGHKRLLTLDDSRRNREALFEVCGRLVKAPDPFANVRLEADMLLSERRLSLENADVKARSLALAALIARYRDTPGEAKCLMMASLIAAQLEDFALEGEIQRKLERRFGGDHDVIVWRRKGRDFRYLPVQFSGQYERADGAVLSFPVDGLGRTSLVCFWSRETPGVEEHLDAIRERALRFPGHFDVLSFNVDDLPDAGEGYLRARGLDWTAFRLPGGRDHLAYRAYAGFDPLVIRVNAHGLAHISASSMRKLADETPMEQNLDQPRYLAQLQSLLVGDFLVGASTGDRAPAGAGARVPAQALASIQACFIEPPHRYRSTRSAMFAKYLEAERLCRAVIEQNGGASDLHLVRDRRIIAMLGMWKLSAEPKWFERAVAESRLQLAAGLPAQATVVARFCLAKATFREGGANPEVVLSGLIEETGGREAPPSALAAAAVLAMDANADEEHERYRGELLKREVSDPALWPVVTFMIDQNHRYRLFKPNVYLPPSRARRVERGALRGNAIGRGVRADLRGVMRAELETLTGEVFSLPRPSGSPPTLLMFVEPPADAETPLPTLINGATRTDARGREIVVTGVRQVAFSLLEQPAGKGVELVTVLLDDDAERGRAFVKRHQWPGRVVMAPGGLDNPLVRRWGILSADRIPNIVLLRSDGTVAWKFSGVLHPQLRAEGIGETVHGVRRGMIVNLTDLLGEQKSRDKR